MVFLQVSRLLPFATEVLLNSPLKAGTALSDPTALLAERVRAVTYESLGPDTVAAVKRLIADGIAVAIAGSVEAPPRIVA